MGAIEVVFESGQIVELNLALSPDEKIQLQGVLNERIDPGCSGQTTSVYFTSTYCLL
jgi:hypothetical protein